MGRAQQILAGRPATARSALCGSNRSRPSPRSCILRLTLAGFLLVVLGCLPASPLVEPLAASPLSDKQGELETTRGRLDRLQQELDEYAAAYGEAEARQAEIDDAIVAAEADERRSRADLGTVQEKLNQRIVSYYKSRGSTSTTVLEVFFTQKSLAGALAQIGQLQRVANQDQDFFNSIGRHLGNVRVLQEDLAVKRTEQAQRVAELDAAQAELESRIQAAATEYKSLKQQVVALEEEERRAREAAANAAVPAAGSAAAVRSFIFPVDGPHSFADTWGAPRSAVAAPGTDNCASRGTPCVAVVSGEINQAYWNQGLGGTCVWLAGSNGVSYYYAHLDGIAAGISPGAGVRAGQVVGWVGNSGNAAGGPCHLHFQAHPGGGSPVNPYPVLAASD